MWREARMPNDNQLELDWSLVVCEWWNIVGDGGWIFLSVCIDHICTNYVFTICTRLYTVTSCKSLISTYLLSLLFLFTVYLPVETETNPIFFLFCKNFPQTLEVTFKKYYYPHEENLQFTCQAWSGAVVPWKEVLQNRERRSLCFLIILVAMSGECNA